MRYMSLLFAERKISSSILMLLVFFSTWLFYSSGRCAMVYYVDDKGVVHFVDDEVLIPEKFRDKKKTIESTVNDKEVSGKGDEKVFKPSIPGTTGSGADIKDKLGNTPSYWRERYKGLMNEKLMKEKELRSLESQREELARRYDSARNKAYFVGDSQSVTEAATLEIKMREIENQIKILLTQLDMLNKTLSVDIQEEILRAGGSPDWLLRD